MYKVRLENMLDVRAKVVENGCSHLKQIRDEGTYFVFMVPKGWSQSWWERYGERIGSWMVTVSFAHRKDRQNRKWGEDRDPQNLISVMLH